MFPKITKQKDYIVWNFKCLKSFRLLKRRNREREVFNKIRTFFCSRNVTYFVGSLVFIGRRRRFTFSVVFLLLLFLLFQRFLYIYIYIFFFLKMNQFMTQANLQQHFSHTHSFQLSLLNNNIDNERVI